MLKTMICVSSFPNENLKYIKEAGFTRIEEGFSRLAAMTEAQFAEHMDFLSGLGFTIHAANGFFGSTLEGFFRGSFDVVKTREYIARAFEITKSIHFDSIAFGSGYMRKMPEDYPAEKAYEFMAQFLSEEVVPYLEKYNTVLSIEELQPLETNFVNTCRDAAKLVKLVNNPRVGILCDFYHMSISGETYEDVPDFAKYITHVHLSSPTNSRAVPLKNDGDNEKYRAFFDALVNNGYKGKYISVEAGVAASVDFGEAMKNCYTYLTDELDYINGKNEEVKKSY